MVKTITQYKTDDGTIFNSKTKATKHEKLCDEINDVMKPLGKLPKDKNCEFGNGGGYLPHDPDVVMQVKVGLVKIARRYHSWFKRHKPENIHPMSHAGRILGDAGPSPLSHAWSRLCCIDDRGREWGQPYYALNPNEGVQQEYKTKRKK
jgi:hypothetical protein